MWMCELQTVVYLCCFCSHSIMHKSSYASYMLGCLVLVWYVLRDSKENVTARQLSSEADFRNLKTNLPHHCPQ